MAVLTKEKQAAEEELARARNKAEQQRISDSQETELTRQKNKLNAEKERAEIRHAMDRAAATKEADVRRIAAKADKDAGLELATKNKELLTDAYLRSLEINALGQNNKIYYGDSVGDVFRLHKEPSV